MSSIKDIIKTEEEAAAILSNAQSQAELIKKEGKEKAAAILAEAEAIRRRAIFENERQSDYSVQLVESCLRQVREQQAAALETVNAAWQQYLCGLYPEDMPSKPAEEPMPPSMDGSQTVASTPSASSTACMIWP